MSKRSAQALLEGTSYRVLDELGAGAMGEVYTAEHVRLKRPVVVKILKPHLGGGMIDRLRLEAQALASLRHDNIVDVLDCDSTTDGRPFLVMERLEGKPLDVYLADQGGWLPVVEALELARQTLSGLHAVHEAGFVHRDIKPANLFRCSSGRIKLLDFGIIKLVTAVTGVEPLSQPTADGIVVGTPKYMAPEQALGKTVDRHTDLYGLGVVLYAMLTGTTPFSHHTNLTQMLYAHVNELPKPPSEVASQAISAGLDRVVLRALAKKASERFDTALDFASELLEQAPSYQQLAVELALDESGWRGGTPLFGRDLSPAPGVIGEPQIGSPPVPLEITVASPQPAAVVVEATVASPQSPAAALGSSGDETEIAPAGSLAVPQASQPAAVDPSATQPAAPWRDPVGWQLFMLCAAATAVLTSLAVLFLGGGG
jgi:serine/threonine protein kinase